MEKHNAVRTGNGQDLTARYSAAQMFFWMELATISGYAAYYLLDAGMTNTQVGIHLALGAAASTLIAPLLAAYADKPQSPSVKMLQLGMAAVMFLLGGVLLGLFHRSFAGTAAVYFVIFLLLQLEKPFLNSLGSETIDQKKQLNFGTARAFGSVGYMILAFVLGRATQSKGAAAVPVVIMVLSAGFFLANALFPFQKSQHLSPQKRKERKDRSDSFFLRYRDYLISLAGCVCLSFGHVCLNSFLLQIVQSKGGSSADMGSIMSITAATELIVMFGYGYLVRRHTSAFWFRISGIFFTLKVLSTLLAPNLGGLYFAALFQPMGWGLIQVSSVYFINDIMAPEDKIKGQAMFTSSHMVAAVLGSMTCGFLLDHGGVGRMLTVGSAVSAVGTILLLIYGKKAALRTKPAQTNL